MPFRYPTDRDIDAATNRVMLWGVFLLAAMVLAFPLYLLVEPTNRAAARELQLQSLEGQGKDLYQLNCSACHGLNGEGGVGPALNSQQFLLESSDKQTELLIAVGVPGSPMGAYSQDHGGPLTSEQIKALATFIRSWEEEAPDVPDWRNPQG
ncbi:MAG: cytochrome c [Acidimicrobiia bacterium]|nr:cytochrome c [Acidimicrobiia bacterium]